MQPDFDDPDGDDVDPLAPPTPAPAEPGTGLPPDESGDEGDDDEAATAPIWPPTE